jgi:hypothetical protein
MAFTNAKPAPTAIGNRLQVDESGSLIDRARNTGQPRTQGDPTTLIGVSVHLPEQCRCGSETAVVGEDDVLSCRSCRRRRGPLSSYALRWLRQTIQEFGYPIEPITLYRPFRCDCSREMVARWEAADRKRRAP